MIVTKLSGGLGNQMFQYAAGFSAAKKLRTDLFLDTREYRYDDCRVFALDAFNISGKIAAPELLPPLKKENYLHYKLHKLLNMSPKYLKQNQFDIHAIRDVVKQSAYLAGFWFSEEYFRDSKAELRNEYKLRRKVSKYSQSVLQQIKNCTSVSVHVRRGDYVAVDYWRERLGSCSANYYYSGLDYIKSAVADDLCVFVFSDDIEWVRSNLQFKLKTYYVSKPSSEFPHEDLILMSSCQHHVIANSTFSWWGAWLNDRSDKIVVCPDVFYVDRRLECVTPTSWKVLSKTA